MHIGDMSFFILKENYRREENGTIILCALHLNVKFENFQVKSNNVMTMPLICI